MSKAGQPVPDFLEHDATGGGNLRDDQFGAYDYRSVSNILRFTFIRRNDHFITSLFEIILDFRKVMPTVLKPTPLICLRKFKMKRNGDSPFIKIMKRSFRFLDLFVFV